MSLLSDRPDLQDKPGTEPDTGRREYVDALRLSLGVRAAAKAIRQCDWTLFVTQPPAVQKPAAETLARSFVLMALSSARQDMTVQEVCDAILDSIEGGRHANQ